MDFLLLVRTQNIGFVELLILMVSIGDTPLTYALARRNVDIVRYLLDHDADPEKRGEHGMTALHVAAGAGTPCAYICHISICSYCYVYM